MQLSKQKLTNIRPTFAIEYDILIIQVVTADMIVINLLINKLRFEF
jgi:hypothetical protein